MNDFIHTLAALTQHAVGSITYGTPVGADYATGSITYGAPDDGDTVIVDGNTFTKVAAAPGAGEFSNIAELEALVEAVTGLNSSEDGSVISITATTRGTAGNAVTLALGGGNTGTMAVSGATLTGGVDGDTVEVDGNTFTCVVGTAGANEFSNITELETLVEAVSGINSSAAGGVISITADAPGTAGNAITLALGGSNVGTMAISGATLTGGVDETYTDVMETPGNPVEVDTVIDIDNITSGGTLTVTPEVSADKQTWIARTATAALNAAGVTELHTSEPLLYLRFKLELGGTGSPAVSGSIKAMPSAG